MNKRFSLALMALAVSAVMLGGCEREADVASRNLSNSADEFKVLRRVVLVNTWTDAYLLEIRGFCSLGNQDTLRARTVTCKTGPGVYKKHFLGLSDTVTYFVEQLDDLAVSGDYYKVNIKPTVLLPSLTLNK